MFKKLRGSKPVIIFLIFIAFFRLTCFSLFMALTNNKNRPQADRKAKLWADRMLQAVQASYELKGELPNFKDGRPYLIISNHASHYDIPAVFATIPASVRMIGKKELFKIPFFGSMMRRHEFVCIDRRNRDQAIKDLAKAREVMKSGIVIWVAAEGTRTRTGKLQAFKKGVFMLALDAQAVIVPMMIKGTGRILPPDGLDFHLGEHITVTLGPCIDTAGMGPGNRDSLMAQVRQIMEGL